MTITILTYLLVAIIGLGTLCAILLKIGTLMATCPINGPAIKISALTIVTGFGAIGLGGIVLIGAIFPLIIETGFNALMVALGLALLCLGLGFTQAMTTLQGIIKTLPKPDPKTS